MKKYDLTIGVPVYNASKYLDNLFGCLKDIDKYNYQLIIINDGSSDNSFEKCKSFNAKNVKLLSQKNHGVSYTRNRIIDLANSDWIIFVDSDDLIDLKKLKLSYDYMKNEEIDYLIDVKNKYQYNYLLNAKKTKIKKISFLIENEIINAPSSKIYNVNILKQNNIYFDESLSLAEDMLFNFTYLNHITKIGYTNNKFYILRFVNEQSLSHKYRQDKYETLMYANNNCKKINTFNNVLIDKALEYIRIKNYFSCVKDEIIVGKNKKEIFSYINNIRKDNPKKYFLLNNFVETSINLLWYNLPLVLLIKLIKYKFRIKG